MRPCKALPQSGARLCQPHLHAHLHYYFAAARRRILTTYRPYSTGGRPEDDGIWWDSSAAAPFGEAENSANNPFNIDPVNKKVKTAAGDLPLSPVMDPSFWEQRQRHKTLKARPRKAQNSVERQFRANAFARALATPLRQCTLTQNRLPKYFMQDFNLVRHPRTDVPWWVPYNLLRQTQRYGSPVAIDEQQEEDDNGDDEDISGAIRKAEEEEAAEREEEKEEEEEAQEADDARAANGSQEREAARVEASETREKGKSMYGPAAYVLARKDLLAALTTPGSGYFNAARRLFGGSSSRYKVLGGKAVWREDLDEYVLRLLRQDIANNLLYLAALTRGKDRYYIVRCFGWDDVQHKHKGSVLWFGEADTKVGEAGGGKEERDKKGGEEMREGGKREKSKGKGPGPFAILDTYTRNLHGSVDPTSVPVHNIPMLLGEELADRVKQDARGVFDHHEEYGSIFMLAGRRSAALQASLWKLQGYLADYRELP